ncbi:MAG: PHP domain-containing protein, partial [Clostridiales bacterium]|nr:PHP domain-containing protein [Clostridiales bacterium]
MTEDINKTPFLKMFPFCSELSDLCGGLQSAFVKEATVNREKLSMNISAVFTRYAAPAELHTLEGRIASEYGLRAVKITAQGRRIGEAQRENPKKTSSGNKEKPMPTGKVIYGRSIKGKPVTMDTLNTESGSVVVSGEIFFVENREIEKRKAWVLCFEMTDNTGSVRVSKYFREGEDKGSLPSLKKGDYVTVSGHVAYNRYDEDIALEPKSVNLGKKPQREDTAEKKRVELHLHTRFSTLDALTDPAGAVKLAAKWGHPAIAVTDHGVAQAFPEMWNAGKKHGIKIIYGIEGYYINDLDDKLAFYGTPHGGMDGEFVAFDIETTGLSSENERMTEIGAVVFRDGVPCERFQTFVNPEKPIPREITELTGITDRDVFDAPDEKAALLSFMEFVGDKTLVAHNAEFDIGFMRACAKRTGLSFSPDYMDTLTLSQALLPDLRRYKLDIVTSRLGLPEFNHHRADDDALACGRIMAKLITMLE